MFNPAGGKAIAAVTPDGAASRVLTYTGVQLGGGGGLVGPGATPSASAGLVARRWQPGWNRACIRYAYTFTTATGESLPSPIGAITVGATRGADQCPECGRGASGRRRGQRDAYLCADLCHGGRRDDGIARGVPRSRRPSASESYYVPNPTQKCTTLLDQGLGANNRYSPGDAIQYLSGVSQRERHDGAQSDFDGDHGRAASQSSRGMVQINQRPKHSSVGRSECDAHADLSLSEWGFCWVYGSAAEYRDHDGRQCEPHCGHGTDEQYGDRIRRELSDRAVDGAVDRAGDCHGAQALSQLERAAFKLVDDDRE